VNDTFTRLECSNPRSLFDKLPTTSKTFFQTWLRAALNSNATDTASVPVKFGD
jgi:hypothetical protein